MAQKKFSTYNSVYLAIKRDSIKNPGVTASLLLECFVFNSGELRAATAEGRGLCELGKFKIWRDDLIAKGWLNYALGDYSRHTPGVKLLKYINKEKLVNTEIATAESVFTVNCKVESIAVKQNEQEKEIIAVDSKVEKLTQEVELLKSSIKKMIEEYDPPVTPAKIARHMPNANDHLKIVKKGELNERSV
jgi:hypothetical protein